MKCPHGNDRDLCTDEACNMPRQADALKAGSREDQVTDMLNQLASYNYERRSQFDAWSKSQREMRQEGFRTLSFAFRALIAEVAALQQEIAQLRKEKEQP